MLSRMLEASGGGMHVSGKVFWKRWVWAEAKEW
jgi:hypothetical protein